MGPSLAAADISLDQARGPPNPNPNPNPIPNPNPNPVPNLNPVQTLIPTLISLDQMRCATELLVNGERLAQGSGAEAPLGGPAEAPGPTSNGPNSPRPISHSPSPSCSLSPHLSPGPNSSPIPMPIPIRTIDSLAFPSATRRLRGWPIISTGVASPWPRATLSQRGRRATLCR